MLTTITAVLTIVLVTVAAYTDIRWAKIRNTLTVPAVVAGLVLNVLNSLRGWDGLLLSLEGIGVGLALFLISSIFGRILGGGDIKLLVGIGALQGPAFLAWTIVYTAVIGGVIGLAIALRHRALLAKLKSLFVGCYLRLTCRLPMDIDQEGSPGLRFPYAIAIGLGTVAYMVVFTWYAP